MRTEAEIRDFVAFMKQIGVNWQSQRSPNLDLDPVTLDIVNDCVTIAMCWVVGEVDLPPDVADEFRQFKESTESN